MGDSLLDRIKRMREVHYLELEVDLECTTFGIPRCDSPTFRIPYSGKITVYGRPTEDQYQIVDSAAKDEGKQFFALVHALRKTKDKDPKKCLVSVLGSPTEILICEK